MKQGIMDMIKSTLQNFVHKDFKIDQAFDINDIIERMQFATLTNSEQELAEWLNVDVSDIAELKAIGEIPFDEIFEIAQRIDVSMSWMISGDCNEKEAIAYRPEDFEGVFVQCNGHILVSERGAIDFMRKEIQSMLDDGKVTLSENFQPMHFEFLGKNFYESLLHSLKKERQRAQEQEDE